MPRIGGRANTVHLSPVRPEVSKGLLGLRYLSPNVNSINRTVLVAGQKIFELRQGRLRVHWFYGQGQCIVILARGALKQSNQTPKQLAKELIALKSRYEEAAKNGQITIV